MRDVVVIGAGHNALVAACYLARSGLDVEVVERDTVPGGGVSTVERFPGYAVDRGSSAHIMIRHTPIADELELAGCGLRYLDMDPWGFAPCRGRDGEPAALTFHADLDRTCASIEKVCGSRDADAYHAWATDWAERNERVFTAFCGPPTTARLGRAALGIGRGRKLAGAEIARQFLTSADHLLDEHFTDERLKTALAWMGAQAGPPPHEVATADLVGWVPMLHHGPPGRPVGGSGALTQALVRRLAAEGGRLRLGDAAIRIETGGGRPTAVRTASGAVIGTRNVLAGCHVLATADLLGPALPGALATRIRRAVRVGNGLGLAVRLGTTDLPRYPAATPESYHGLQLLAADRRTLAAAYGDYLAGRPPAEPPAVVMTCSALDPGIAPPGRHNITVWGQWYPYELAGGASWDDVAAQAAEQLVGVVEAAAPGFAATVEHTHVQTPLSIERELAMPRGNVMHVEMGLDGMFALRPLPELAGYRFPGLPGLYLTGASTHPGGGVFGASGRTAAHVILSDLRRVRRAPRIGPTFRVPGRNR